MVDADGDDLAAGEFYRVRMQGEWTMARWEGPHPVDHFTVFDPFSRAVWCGIGPEALDAIGDHVPRRPPERRPGRRPAEEVEGP